MNKTNLFDDFSPVSAKAWKQKIQVDLKGADYNKTLVWESPEGIKVKPFYHADDFEELPSKGPDSNKEWHVGQTIFAADALKANQKAQDALKRGAESLVFTIPSEEIKIELLLSGIDLHVVPVYFNFQFLSSDYVKKLVEFTGGAWANIYLNIDIIGHLARTGNWFFNLEQDHKILNEILEHAKNIPSIAVDTALFQNAGANRVQQLAYAMAQANEYLNHFDRAKSTDHIGKIVFKVCVDTNYFFEIAKLRALRLLWSTLVSEYGIIADCHILAFPTKRNKTIYDYNVNMLRTTTECMAAVLGGADTVCNLPYDAIYHKDNEFGERIARNQLLILKNESYFDKVSNPADGAYYIESLTRQMAQKALELFKTIEGGGGFLKQLKGHTIQKKIKESALREQEHFEAKEEVLVGSNKYPNEKDKMKDDLKISPFVKTNARKTLIEPILEKRLAESLEQKRMDHE